MENDTLETVLSVAYLLVCAFLIFVVLIQSGKGGGMGALGGGMGGGGQTVFGGAGAGNFLTKLTWASAAAFMILSATLAYIASSGNDALDAADDGDTPAVVGDGDDSNDDDENEEEDSEDPVEEAAIEVEETVEETAEELVETAEESAEAAEEALEEALGVETEDGPGLVAPAVE